MSLFHLQTSQVAEHTAPPTKKTDGVSGRWMSVWFVCRGQVLSCLIWSPIIIISVLNCETLYIKKKISLKSKYGLFMFFPYTVAVFMVTHKWWDFLYESLWFCLVSSSCVKAEIKVHSCLAASSLKYDVRLPPCLCCRVLHNRLFNNTQWLCHLVSQLRSPTFQSFDQKQRQI